MCRLHIVNNLYSQCSYIYVCIVMYKVSCIYCEIIIFRGHQILWICEKGSFPGNIILWSLSFIDLFMNMNSFSWGHEFVDKGIHEINENYPPPTKHNDFTVD